MTPESTERRTLEIGRSLLAEIGHGPSPLDRAWWDDRLMALTMDDPSVKVQLFRFIDALPALGSGGSVAAHLRDYIDQADGKAPHWLGRAVGGRFRRSTLSISERETS